MRWTTRRAAAAAALVTAALAVIARDIADIEIDPRLLAVVAAAMAAAFMLGLALVSFLSWRLTADRRSLYISTACCCFMVAPLLAGVVLPSVSSTDLTGAGAAFQMAGLPALAVFGLAARDPIDLARLPARRMVPLLLGATIVVAAAALMLPSTPGVTVAPGGAATIATQVGLGLVAVAWSGVAVAHAAARRGPAQSAWCWAVAAAGVAATHAVGALPGSWTGAVAWGVMVAALLTALVGAIAELQRHHNAERQELRDALVRAAVATSRSQSVDRDRAEVRHDARAALLGIEAAAQGLARQRYQLTPDQWRELSTGLVAEVHRLGALLDDERDEDEVRQFDLRDAAMPVVAAARAEGVLVILDVAPGIAVRGARDDARRVLLTLLDNARVHAAGSDVQVRAHRDGGAVVVQVDDRGPGVPSWLHPSLFERGACGGPSAGSGLGLHAARRIAESSGGSLTFTPRAGGGSSFAVRLPLGMPDEVVDPPATAPSAAAATGERHARTTGDVVDLRSRTAAGRAVRRRRVPAAADVTRVP